MNLGQCVPRDQKCDGTPQCDDASDEDSFYAGCIGKHHDDVIKWKRFSHY